MGEGAGRRIRPLNRFHARLLARWDEAEVSGDRETIRGIKDVLALFGLPWVRVWRP